ncbi:Bro-N domain-containing protein [Patescibacteria group bacterium]|nr:Bro-N domain-containing protein [Patescibacteria group bacterium]MBU2219549.1 Bro-N domain-containing protein [Patescibacteria group bacterium]MBU2264620.1 Bro-N domain-containing protein [Patescibacteria group bacterium]
MPDTKNPNTHLAIFRGKTIRKVLWQKEWWFSVVDVIGVLTNSVDAGAYWRKLKQRLTEEGSEVVTFCHGLKLEASDGKFYETDCANTEGIFRIIQSVPSPKAEPLKRWLSKVGYERVREIENPELATKRTRILYKLKGYPDDWIEKRMRGIAIREELTDEWQKRGAREQKDYEILTAEISKATFGLIPQEYKKLKGLKRENLRDHMDDFELILTMLSERTTTEIRKTENSQGVPKLKTDARIGGQIAGSTRKQIERRIGRPIVSKRNFLPNKTQKELNASRATIAAGKGKILKSLKKLR